MLEEKRHTRKNDEARKPLQAYQNEELQRMWLNFFGADRRYHLARKNFVYKGLMPSRDRGDTSFERGSGGFLDGARQCAGDERCGSRDFPQKLISARLLDETKDTFYNINATKNVTSQMVL